MLLCAARPLLRVTRAAAHTTVASQQTMGGEVATALQEVRGAGGARR